MSAALLLNDDATQAAISQALLTALDRQDAARKTASAPSSASATAAPALGQTPGEKAFADSLKFTGVAMNDAPTAGEVAAFQQMLSAGEADFAARLKTP
jgi:hypothetical protein